MALPRRGLAPLLALLLLPTTACQREVDGQPSGNASPHRIVSLTCNATDIFVLLGALDRVIAVEEDCPAPGTEGKVMIRNDDHAGKAKILNIEAVLALHPDLVVCRAALREVLGPLGVRMLWPPPRLDLQSMPGFVRDLARTVGEEARGEQLLQQMQQRTAALQQRVAGARKVRVYYEGTGLGRSAGRLSVMHAMIELAGGSNLGAAIDRPGVVLTNEAILAADPEVIVLSPFADPTEEILLRPGWQGITAVKTGRIHRIPLDERYVLLATPRCVQGCEQFLLPWFHPELVESKKER